MRLVSNFLYRFLNYVSVLSLGIPLGIWQGQGHIDLYRTTNRAFNPLTIIS